MLVLHVDMFPIQNMKSLYMPISMFVTGLVFEFREFNWKRRS